MDKTPRIRSSHALSTCLGAGFVVAMFAAACTQDFDGYITTGGASSTSSSPGPTTTGPGPTSTTTTTTTVQSSSSTGPGECVPGDSCEESPPNPCTTDACVAGTCEHTPNDGMMLPDESSTDCVRQECMGSVATDVADADDMPDVDPLDCTVLTCDGTMVNTMNVAVNTACGMGANTKCDGNGNCVGCVVAGDCGMPVDNDCFTWICGGGGMCQQMIKPAADLDSNPSGDCQRRVCDGVLPDPQLVADNADPQSDNNQCTTDTCAGANNTTHTNVMAGGACNMGGSVCNNNGMCCAPAACDNVTCGNAVPTGCDTTQMCGCGNAALPNCDMGAGVCRACVNDGQCAANNNGHDCLGTFVCGCDADDDCNGIAGRPQCESNSGNPLFHTCQECDDNADCSANNDGTQCDNTNDTCGCNVAGSSQCVVGRYCPAGSGARNCTAKKAAGQACAQDYECLNGDCLGTNLCN